MTNQISKREQRLINIRNKFIGAGVIGAGVASTQTHAAITADQVQAKYDSSGAEKTADASGLIAIGVAVSVMVVGMIIKLIRK